MSNETTLEIDTNSFLEHLTKWEAKEQARIVKVVTKRSPITWSEALRSSHLNAKRFSWHVKRLVGAGAIIVTEYTTGVRVLTSIPSSFLVKQVWKEGERTVKEEAN